MSETTIDSRSPGGMEPDAPAVPSGGAVAVERVLGGPGSRS